MKRAVLPAVLVTIFFLAVPLPHTHADTAADLEAQLNAQNQQIDQLNKEIAQYEAQIAQAKSDKATLQNAINTLNLERKKIETQVSATEKQIASTNIEIRQLGSSISDTQTRIETDQAALAADIRDMAQGDDEPFIASLLSSDSLADAWSDVDAMLEIQQAVQDQVANLTDQKQQLAASQAASEAKKAQLTSQQKTLSSQQNSLTQTKQQKTKLLAQTNASEANYEKLLATAQAELQSFSTFATNAGGSGLVPHETTCDSWGCYYNQRDVAWGNDALNGTQYLLKSDGCLVTSMAMVMTHYGYKDVTPVTINSNPANFAAYYPAYLLFTINVDGVSATRKAASINAILATGNPVIVGLYAYGGTHYVVLTGKGSGGDYLMRDPYIPNGKDISFSAHYSLDKIFGVSKVVIDS